MLRDRVSLHFAVTSEFQYLLSNSATKGEQKMKMKIGPYVGWNDVYYLVSMIMYRLMEAMWRKWWYLAPRYCYTIHRKGWRKLLEVFANMCVTLTEVPTECFLNTSHTPYGISKNVQAHFSTFPHSFPFFILPTFCLLLVHNLLCLKPFHLLPSPSISFTPCFRI
jgi:hypothetical protein